jgi:type IV pilus assembly protein PilY1
MVYVGANDGMLHAFNADTGREVFAYVPRAVYPKLWELTDPDYNDRHLYFVDGSPYVGEAYIGGAWGSYLVSGLGAGGRSVFAINVTSPTGVTASQVLWEYMDSDLCYTFSQPQIARLPNGQWAAIFGNGYPKTSGSYQCSTTGAYLYVVDLATGALIRKIGMNAGSVTYDGTNNGLSTPALVDTDNDRIVDTVYAGDLYGNLWKFDLSSPSASSWGVANRAGPHGRPLFSARNADGISQPITAPVEVGRHPSGGFMVYFGTGRYVAEGDPSDLTVQSFYGIWDRPMSGTSNEITYTSASRSSVLQEQTLLSETTVSGRDVRTVSANNVNWSTQRGWFLDLIRPTSPPQRQGERVVDAPLLRFGRVIFNTLIPSTSACSFGGTSWLMELSAVTGQRLAETVLDINGDGLLNANDYVGGVPVSGMRSSVGITSTPAVISAGAQEFKIQSGSDTTGTNEGIQVTRERGGDRLPRGSWRQIIAR